MICRTCSHQQTVSRLGGDNDYTRWGQINGTSMSFFGILLAVPALPSSGHHGNTEYDLRVIVRYEGTVLEQRWMNPHSVMSGEPCRQRGEVHTHGHIRVIVAAFDEHAEITVQDNGDGIPPDRLEDIFETFTQLRPASGGPGLGLGLGLALVRRLTELQGGSIHVFSEVPGRGSRFTVRLPAAQRSESSVRA